MDLDGGSASVPQDAPESSTTSGPSTDPPQKTGQATSGKDSDTTGQAPKDTAHAASKPSETGRVSASTLCQSTSEFPPETAYAATPTIYEALRNLRSWPGKGQAQKIRRLVRYLVEDRGERPNIFLYEALVTANWDPATGSADEVAEIYREMRTAGIQPSQAWYHSALRVCLEEARLGLENATDLAASCLQFIRTTSPGRRTC